MQAYDAQTVYDPYFRPTVDETARGIGLQYPQEVNFWKLYVRIYKQ